MRILETLTVSLLAASLSSPAFAAAVALSVQTDTTPVPQATNARDALLIASVEQAYQAGVAAYQAGKGEEARKDFDKAVDTLLQSGRDVKGTPALSTELDRMVDSINTLQVDALRQGTPLAPKEDTPVDVANDVTFPVDPNVTAKAIAELRTTQSDLPLLINDYVASYINFFENTPTGHATIVASLERAGKYKAMIQRILKQERVPQDLVYQAVAESGFRPTIVNPKSGAAGMWQFMPFGTYGLARTGWYDERFDPEKATRAYAREMKKAYAQLGNWLLKRNNLPQETKNYVPIILAVAIMAKNPKQYGLDTLVPDAAIQSDTVVTNYSISLQLAGDITGASPGTMSELNPSLLRGRTPPDEPFDLHVPGGTAELFKQRIAEIPDDKRTSWRFHVLESGDTLGEIARVFHTSVSQIAFTNQLTGDSLDGVQALVIPVAQERESAGRNAIYRVRPGDTLINIADQFGVTVASLRRWNHLRGHEVRRGQRLYVSEPARIRHILHAKHGHPKKRRPIKHSSRH